MNNADCSIIRRVLSASVQLLMLPLAGCFLCEFARPAIAAPFVESVDPPVLPRGATTRVTLIGTGLEQPVAVWTSSPGAVITGTPSGLGSDREAVLDVVVPDEAPMGLFGLRLATRSGLSNVHLVLIDQLPVTRAGSLKTSIDGSVHIQLPACVAAACRPEAIDKYSINVQSGQRVSFEVIGSRFGKDYDPLVTIRDAAGRRVAQSDNHPGLFFDCRFSHTFEQAGRHLIEVRDSRYDGHPSWKYVLRAGSFPAASVSVPSAISPDFSEPFRLPEAGDATATLARPLKPDFRTSYAELRTEQDDVATWIPISRSSLENRFEAEPNDQKEQATPVSVPSILNGVLEVPGDQDWFALDLVKGQTVTFTGVSAEAGAAADLELVFFDDTGRELRRVDDLNEQRFDKPFVREARFDLNIGRAGRHHLLVRDVARSGGFAFAYRVEVSTPTPRIELSADYSRFTIPKNSWQPIPIHVQRSGFAGPITLTLEGAPAGVSLSPLVIPADAAEIECRLAASNSAPESLATISIHGHWKSEDGTQSVEASVEVHPMIDRQPYNKDRQLYSLRENQLRLPPSVTDRMALMVTPAAPFEFSLPLAELILTKYQTASFPLETPRQNGFDAAISFSATGGQVGDPDEERDQVYVVIPDAIGNQQQVAGVLHNRINTRYERKRCDVSATALVDGHEVTLIRSFGLDIRSGFKPSFEPTTVTLEPGSKVSARVFANRTPTHRGEVRLSLQRSEPDVTIPDEIVIPETDEFVDVEIGVPDDARPRRFNLRYQSVGYVGKYEESLNEPALTIDVKQPAPAK
jgi:hypothetical protein